MKSSCFTILFALAAVLASNASAAPIEMKPGRKQLFLDDHVIEQVRGLERTMHRPEKRGAVLKPDTPSDGDVSLDGRRLAHMTDDEITIVRRRQVGFIFQFFNLLPTLSAAENVALPLLIDGKRIETYAEQVDELLGLVGLGDRRDHRPDQLSGGQQQRVAIARALVTEPAIVLADEPTGNLDSKSGKEILGLLRRACDEKEQTIVMVTHDPRAASYADRVVFLRDGLMVRELGAEDQGPALSRAEGIDVQTIMDIVAELEP